MVIRSTFRIGEHLEKEKRGRCFIMDLSKEQEMYLSEGIKDHGLIPLKLHPQRSTRDISDCSYPSTSDDRSAYSQYKLMKLKRKKRSRCFDISSFKKHIEMSLAKKKASSSTVTLKATKELEDYEYLEYEKHKEKRRESLDCLLQEFSKAAKILNEDN